MSLSSNIDALATRIATEFNTLRASLAETIRDTMASALVAGSNVTITVDDPGNTITIASTGGSGSVSDGDKGDVVVSATGATWLLDPNVFGRSYLIDTGRIYV